MNIEQKLEELLPAFVTDLEVSRKELDKKYKQREEYIIALYKKGKSVAEIARLFHMQYQNVSRIIAPYRSTS